MNTGQFLLLIVPLLVVQVVLAILALRDLALPNRTVLGGNKALWAIVIIFGELLGPVAYYLAGRRNA